MLEGRSAGVDGGNAEAAPRGFQAEVAQAAAQIEDASRDIAWSQLLEVIECEIGLPKPALELSLIKLG